MSEKHIVCSDEVQVGLAAAKILIMSSCDSWLFVLHILDIVMQHINVIFKIIQFVFLQEP